MRNKVVIILLYCLLVNSSCVKDDAKERDILDQLGDKTSPDYYLIIPIKGCSGCVEEMLVFLKDNIRNSRVTFVLTSNEPKVFNLILSNEELNSDNVLLDSKNLFEKSGIVAGPNFLLIRSINNDFVDRKILNATNLTSELAQLKTLIK